MTIRQSDYTDFAHTGLGRLAGRYLRRFWQPICVARDLAAGRAVPVRVMCGDFTLYRGQGGKPHLVAFRCAHRGTQLSTGWVEGDCIRCFYHGWKYDETGQCVEQPGEEVPAPAGRGLGRGSFAGKVRINSYPTQEYLGLIFAYLGDGLPPELPRYPDFEDEGVLTISSYVRDCNWFQNLENVVDEVHVAFTHRVSEFGKHGLYVVPEVWAEESDWGVTMYAKRPGEMVRVTQLGMPNMANVAGSPTTDDSGWEDFIAWRVPIDDTVHRSFNVHIAHAQGEAAERYREAAARRRHNRPDPPTNVVSQQVLRGQVAWAEIEHRPDIVGIQDYVSQVGQGVFADRQNERLGKSDVGIIILRKIYARELRALAKGQPLKAWKRTDAIRTAAGAI